MTCFRGNFIQSKILSATPTWRTFPGVISRSDKIMDIW